MHMYRQHGLRSDISKYISTPFCKVCLPDFGTRIRCLNHVAYNSPVCRLNYVLRNRVLTREVQEELDKIDAAKSKELARQGRRPHYAAVMAKRLQGSLLPILGAMEASNQHSLGPKRRWLR